MSNLFERHIEEAAKMYAEAIPCEGWAYVQVSKRKYLILKETGNTGCTGGMTQPDKMMRLPKKYKVVHIIRNGWGAVDYIRRVVLGEIPEPAPLDCED